MMMEMSAHIIKGKNMGEKNVMHMKEDYVIYADITMMMVQCVRINQGKDIMAIYAIY